MGKEHGPERSSGKGIQATPGKETPPDRRPIGSGSESGGFYIDEFGRSCYGDKCVQIAVDTSRQEVVVNVKPNATCDVSDFVEAIKQTVGKGARTVYELDSEIRVKPKGSKLE